MSRRMEALTLTTVIALAAACAEQDSPTGSTQLVLVQNVDAPRGQLVTIDDRFAAIAELDSAFGGMYTDADGQLNVLLTDATRAAAVRTAITAVFTERPDLQTRPISATQADFSWSELYSWSRNLPRVFSVPGVVRIGIDETRNRLTVDVETMEVRGSVEAALASLDIPLSAVIIEVGTRGTLGSARPAGGADASRTYMDLARARDDIVRARRGDLDLEDSYCPYAGGFETHTRIIGATDIPCTLGFTATRNSHADTVMVTAGHCTEEWGTSSDESDFYQCCWVWPSSSTNFLGTEIAEAALFSSAEDSRCPTSEYECRYSDAALVEYDSTATVGFTANTSTRSRQISFPIDIEVESLFVTYNQVTGVLVGDTVNKMGKTSGWTYGPVVSSCDTEKFGVGSDSLYIVCYDKVEAGSAGGDSGAPVFLWTEEMGDSVYLAGQLFGGRVENGDTLFFFSPMNNIQVDASVGSLWVVYCPSCGSG